MAAMADEPTLLPAPTYRARSNSILAALVFHSVLICALLAYGDPNNSLHTSGLAWSFVVWIGALATWVGGAIWESVLAARSAR